MDIKLYFSLWWSGVLIPRLAMMTWKYTWSMDMCLSVQLAEITSKWRLSALINSSDTKTGILRDALINTMALDAPAPCLPRASATILLNLQINNILYSMGNNLNFLQCQLCLEKWYKMQICQSIFWKILLTHWPLGDLDVILKMQSSILRYWLVSSNLLMIVSSDECHRTLLIISQHCFR